METNNKLREALKDIGRLVEQIHFLYSDYPSEIHEIARKVNVALAEPPKNCEVGTVEEQMKRFDKFCDSNTRGVVCNDDCPLRKNTSGSSCELTWAQLPYEAKEGVAK